jgi:hypothetical protein
MATNLEIQTQFNNLLESAKTLIESQNKLLKNQSDILTDLATKAQKINFKNTTTEAQQLTEALKETAKQGGKAANSQSSFYEEIRKQIGSAGDETSDLSKVLTNMIPISEKLSVTMSFWKGLKEGVSGVVAVSKSLTSIIGGAARTLGHLALSIISFPFSLLQNLIHDASQSGSNELAQALEDIRKEFGYLDKTAGGTIVRLGRSMRGELANTGLSVYRVFGNLAERLRYFLEYSKNLGETIDAAMRNIDPRRDAEALGAFNKALGLTGEGQKAIAQRSIATGQEINEVNRQIANYAIQLSDAFGVTMKEVGRDIGKMMSDFQHFGHLGVKELGQVAVYTRRLGIEFKQLASVMDKFTNFEDAANGAAQLSQAFGLNVDAFKLMQEQDPAKKLEQLRKAFFAAGRTVENMSYQERRLLAQQTGLDDASVQLAFSLKSQSLSYDQIAKKGDQAKKKQLSQAEALEKLAGAIERMVQSGGVGGGGFLDRFLRGFEVGIKRSQEFRHLMQNLRRALVDTYYAGIQVGRAFVDSFPGIKDWFNGIAGIFEPRRFRNMLNRVVDAFKTFFKDLQDDPRAGFRKFTQKLKEGFTNWFDKNESSGRKILNSFKAFFKVTSGIFAEGMKIAIQGVTKGIKFITDIIAHPEKLASLARTGKGAGGFVATLITPSIKAIKEAWPEFKSAFVDLAKVALPKIAKELKIVFEKSWPYIATAIFGPAFSRAIITTLGNNLIASVGKAASNVTSSVFSIFNKTTNSIAKAQQASGGASSAVASPQAAKGMKGFFENLAKIQMKDIGKAFVLMTAIAGALAVGGVAMAISILAISKIIGGIPKNKLIASMSVLGLTVLATIPLTKALTQTSNQEMKDAIKKMATVSGLLAAIGLVSVGIVFGFKMLGDIDPTTIFSAITTMGAMTALVRVGIVPLVNSLTKENINTTNVAKSLLAVGAITALIGATSVGVISAFSKMNVTMKTVNIATASMGAMTGIFIAVSLFTKILNSIDIGSASKILKTFGIVSVITGGIAFVAYEIANNLGKLDLGAIKTSVLGIGMVEILMASTIPLILGANFVGNLVLNSSKEIVAGMLAMGLTIAAIGGTTFILNKILGKTNINSLRQMTTIMGSMVAMFYAVSPLIVVATAIGGLMLTGIGAAALIAGMIALSKSLASIIGTASGLIQISKNLNSSDFINMVSITAAMSAMFTSVSGLILIATGIGAISIVASPLLVAGAAVMNSGLKQLLLSASNLTKLQSSLGLTVTSILQLSTIIGTFGALFTTIGALLPIAAAVGVAVVATFGIGGTLIKKGMETISTSISSIMEGAKSLIISASKVRYSGQLKTQVDLVLQVSNSIAGFAPLLAKSLDVLRPGLTEIIFGRNSNTTEMIKTFTQFMSALIGTSSSGGIIGLVVTIQNLIGSLNRFGNVEQITRGTEAIASIMQAIGEFIKAAVVGPAGGSEGGIIGVVTSVGDFARSLVGARSRTQETVNGLTTTINQIMPTISGLVTTLFDQITRLMTTSNITENGLKAAQALGDVFQSITGVLTALNPPREFFEAAGRFRTVSTKSVTTGLQRETIDAYVGLLRQNTESIRLILTQSQNMISELIPILSNLSPRQLESLKVAMPLLGAITEITKGIGSAISGLGTIATTSGTGSLNVQAVTTVVGQISSVFSGIGEGLINTITTVIRNISRINFSGASGAKIGALKNVFELFASIGNVYKNFTQRIRRGSEEIEVLNGGVIYETIRNVTAGLGWLFDPNHGEAQNFIKAIQGIDSLPIKNPSALKAKVEAIKSVFETIALIPRAIDALRSINSGNANTTINTNALDVPLMNFSNVVNNLSSQTIGKDLPNPLVNNNLTTMLASRRFTGISDTVKRMIVKVGESLVDINNVMVDLGRIPDSASGVLQGQNRIISSLINFSTTIQRVSSQVETISKIIPNFINRAKIQHFATITRDLKAMVEEVNKVSEELSQLHVANIDVSMKNIANILGVKAEQLTIQHRNFAININVNVKMDASQIERALIDRTDSRIEIRPVEGLPPLRFRR